MLEWKDFPTNTLCISVRICLWVLKAKVSCCSAYGLAYGSCFLSASTSFSSSSTYTCKANARLLTTDLLLLAPLLGLSGVLCDLPGQSWSVQQGRAQGKQWLKWFKCKCAKLREDCQKSWVSVLFSHVHPLWAEIQPKPLGSMREGCPLCFSRQRNPHCLSLVTDCMQQPPEPLHNWWHLYGLSIVCSDSGDASQAVLIQFTWTWL